MEADEGRGVLVNERLHWIEDTTGHVYTEDVFISVFNLEEEEEEEFGKLLGLSQLLRMGLPTTKYQLCAINGLLGVNSMDRFDNMVWILIESEWDDYYFLHNEDACRSSFLFFFIFHQDIGLSYYLFDKETYEDAICYMLCGEPPVTLFDCERSRRMIEDDSFTSISLIGNW